MNKELNLIPQTFNEVKEDKRKKTSFILGFLGVILVAVLVFGATLGYEFYLGAKEKKLKNEVELNKSLINKEKELQEDIIRTQAHIDKAKSLETIKSQKTDEIFIRFQELFPSTIKLTKCDYTKEYDKKNNVVSYLIQANGESTSKDDITVLWAKLRESSEFKQSNIKFIDTKDNVSSFSLEVILTPGGAKNETK